jgi:hypothetical protein
MPAGHKTATRGGTAWVSRIKPVETQTTGCHFIEYWSLYKRMTVVARFIPTVVIAHQEDDVGKLLLILIFYPF